MAVENTVKLASEVDSCDIVLEDIQSELCFEMEHNDRKDIGNQKALRLFRTMWDSICSFSPLFRKALNRKDERTVQSEHADDGLQVVFVAICEIDRLFLRQMNGPREARDIVVLLYGRICYLRRKLRAALRNPRGPKQALGASGKT